MRSRPRRKRQHVLIHIKEGRAGAKLNRPPALGPPQRYIYTGTLEV